jgi:hypothetical protein
MRAGHATRAAGRSAAGAPCRTSTGRASRPRGPGKPLFFSGIFTGLHRTAPSLRQTGTVDPVIPPLVFATEGYNHVGDIGYQGGRVLLPLECYTPGGPNGGNTCGTGSIGVADPATLPSSTT